MKQSSIIIGPRWNKSKVKIMSHTKIIKEVVEVTAEKLYPPNRPSPSKEGSNFWDLATIAPNYKSKIKI